MIDREITLRSKYLYTACSYAAVKIRDVVIEIINKSKLKKIDPLIARSIVLMEIGILFKFWTTHAVYTYLIRDEIDTIKFNAKLYYLFNSGFGIYKDGSDIKYAEAIGTVEEIKEFGRRICNGLDLKCIATMAKITVIAPSYYEVILQYTKDAVELPIQTIEQMLKELNDKTSNEKTPEKLGQLLYQVIQGGLSHENCSVEALLRRLELAETDVVGDYQSEIIIALIFPAILAIEKHYDYPLAGDILDGMIKEFLSHAKEMGGTEEDLKNFMALFHYRIKEYYETVRNSTGEGPFYWIGKKFYENLIGKNQSHVNDHDKDTDIPTKLNFDICANHLTANLAGIDGVLKEYTVEK